jgi:hypothetical protein
MEPLLHNSTVAVDESHPESPACFSSIATIALPTSVAETVPGGTAADDSDGGSALLVANPLAVQK